MCSTAGLVLACSWTSKAETEAPLTSLGGSQDSVADVRLEPTTPTLAGEEGGHAAVVATAARLQLPFPS